MRLWTTIQRLPGTISRGVFCSTWAPECPPLLPLTLVPTTRHQTGACKEDHPRDYHLAHASAVRAVAGEGLSLALAQPGSMTLARGAVSCDGPTVIRALAPVRSNTGGCSLSLVLSYSDLFNGLRAMPKGLLLFGPPGTGKTLIGKCIASQVGRDVFLWVVQYLGVPVCSVLASQSSVRPLSSPLAPPHSPQSGWARARKWSRPSLRWLAPNFQR